MKDSLNKEFYDIADAVYYEVYKEHFDKVVYTLHNTPVSYTHLDVYKRQAFTIPAQAITIEELTSQPQFKQVSQFVSDIPNVDERGASYIDVNTVKVIGFEPPIYTIKATVYKAYQWNDEKVITVKDMTFTYDSSNSTASKIYRAQQQGSATSNTCLLYTSRCV